MPQFNQNVLLFVVREKTQAMDANMCASVLLRPYVDHWRISRESMVALRSRRAKNNKPREMSSTAASTAVLGSPIRVCASSRIGCRSCSLRCRHGWHSCRRQSTKTAQTMLRRQWCQAVVSKAAVRNSHSFHLHIPLSLGWVSFVDWRLPGPLWSHVGIKLNWPYATSCRLFAVFLHVW